MREAMKRSLEKLGRMLTIASLFVLILSEAVLADESYDIGSIRTLEIIFEEDNWDQILDNYYLAGNDERLIGTAYIDGILYESVGVKYKGNSSYEPDRIKNPLNIKLDYVLVDQKLDGYGTLKLANEFLDPSYLREVLGYEIARKYTPAGKANFINVYINDELIGLYSNVQSVDKFFLANNYYSNDNVFIKGDCSEFQGSEGGARLKYLGQDSTLYYPHYEMKSEYGWKNLVDLCDTLNNQIQDIEEVLNVDRTLWFLAYHNLLLSFDSPINAPRNYYLYKDGTDRFNIIFWDLNMTFGNYLGDVPGSPNPQLSDLQQLDPFYNTDNPEFPILNKLLQIMKYRKRYISHMKTIMEENFVNGWYMDRGLELQEIIDQDVQADPNNLFTYQDFLDNLHQSSGGGFVEIFGIEELMMGRVEWLETHPMFSATAPLIENVDLSPSEPTPNSTIWITAEIIEAENAYIGYRESLVSKFVFKEMFDDGQHEDGNSGDGVYGVSIQTGNSNIQYYLLAENDNVSTYLPKRAEYEYFTVDIVGNLVINEFLASNNNVVVDQDGEYDDWVELYNNSDSDINLNGFYLSDDIVDPQKWVFPDTSISANDYLIVWTDNDVEQEGLHTNFKLSASGEQIILFDFNNETMDECSFGEQDENLSFGRFPNGNGAFVQMSPTFAEENVGEVNSVNVDNAAVMPEVTCLAVNYPNPFNSTTNIRFYLAESGKVELYIYNVLGEKIATLHNSDLIKGHHEVCWEGKGTSGQKVSSGLYLSVLKTSGIIDSRKILMLK